MPTELVKGEHFVIAGLLKSILGSSSQARTVYEQEPQAETTEGGLASFVRPDQSPLVEQDSQPTPHMAKNVGQVKAASIGLESFVDWVDPISCELAEKREDDMFSLVVGFATRMRKRATSDQRETTSVSEGLGGNCPKRSGPNEEAQKSLIVITVESPKRAPNALSALKWATQDASREACMRMRL